MNRDNDVIRHQKRSELNTLNVCKLVTWTKFPKADPPHPWRDFLHVFLSHEIPKDRKGGSAIFLQLWRKATLGND